MKRTRMIFVAMVALAIVAPASAEEGENPPPMVAKNYYLNANPGQALEFETAYKDHIEWHASKNDSWYWHTWQVANGQDLGQYIVRTGGHSWADFDENAEFSAEDSAHFTANVSQFVQDASSILVVGSPEISNWPEDYGMPMMVDVTVFQIDGASGRVFYHAIKKLHEAILKKEIPFTYSWSFVVSGAEGPTWSLVFPYQSWAEYGEDLARPFWEMVEEVYGDYETDMLRKMISKSVTSQENFIAAFREDLSYEPPE